MNDTTAETQRQVDGLLINRLHLYPSEPRDVLAQVFSLWVTAGYEPAPIGESRAAVESQGSTDTGTTLPRRAPRYRARPLYSGLGSWPVAAARRLV